jgi:lipid II:glycine glycyltransferase (peptidoglycan interpeptide bridge formation enzyme)
MSDGETAEQPELTKKQKSRLEKQRDHIDRIKRTLIACLLGMFVGVVSYLSGGSPDPATGLQNNGLLAFMLMLAAIVIQKHIFLIIGIDTDKLGGKDWFYQSFMTFALWFMTWAILLSAATVA